MEPTASASESRGDVLAAVDSLILHLLRTIERGERPKLQGNRGKSIILAGDRRGNVFLRVLRVLSMLQEMAWKAEHCTQRDLYYRLVDAGLVQSTSQAYAAIQDAAAALRLTRLDVGISCASKGLVAGSLRARGPGLPWRSGTDEIIHIPGALEDVLNLQLDLQDPKAIIVVEKEAIFDRVVRDSFFVHFPSVLLTAKRAHCGHGMIAQGMPDQASRALLRRLHVARPDVPVLGVVDYNPAGLVILSAFLLGGASGDEYAVPVQWLGMRRQQLAELGVQSQGAGGAMLRCLSDLDRSVLEGVRRKLADHGHLGWDDEAAEMAAFGRKVELECVLDAPGVSPAAPSGAVSRFLLHAALCRQYVSSS